MTDSRHEDLAAFIGCTVADVETAFGDLFGFALWAAERSETGVAKKEATNLRAIADELDKVPGSDLSDMRDELQMRAKAAEHFTDNRAYPATKGRRERARVIACAVARVFVATGRNIGKGTSQNDAGEPTSKYGQAVKQALELYGIRANWRQPAKDAAAQYSNTN
ncbi:hypothetical protein [Salipiger abyssi]|uniref:hypothetical protein n=1 Tax=Salipiger abyssi TaxID=1250539 RepID=UPI001A8D5F45|nr:hypothetical protein [Salipiger abyssi]MBN9889682.1 hypothetical protein [Salipiger abyssi]